MKTPEQVRQLEGDLIMLLMQKQAQADPVTIKRLDQMIETLHLKLNGPFVSRKGRMGYYP